MQVLIFFEAPLLFGIQCITGRNIHLRYPLEVYSIMFLPSTALEKKSGLPPHAI